LRGMGLTLNFEHGPAPRRRAWHRRSRNAIISLTISVILKRTPHLLFISIVLNFVTNFMIVIAIWRAINAFRFGPWWSLSSL
jgi:hypothetical protein